LNLWSYPRAFCCTGPMGAIGTRLSLRPLSLEGQTFAQASDASRRENAAVWRRRQESIRAFPFLPLTHITDRLLVWSIASGLSIAMPQPHEILFRTLADPTRRALFERLCRDGDQTVGALTAQAGVSQPAVSKHLGVLKQAGLVRDRHEGRQTHYSAQLGALAALTDWTSQMTGFWQSRFDQLEDLLKRMDQ
jgi:DNA-binding transcriptional ArsR family regulator